MSERRRVAITGIGAITPIGLTRDGLWTGLREQRSAVRPVSRFDPSMFRSRMAAEVNDFVPTDHLEHRRAKRLDRFAQFSVVSGGLVCVAGVAVIAKLLPELGAWQSFPDPTDRLDELT